MNNQFPGYQNMVAHQKLDQIVSMHRDYLNYYNANENDCRIVDIKECDSWDKSRGLNCRYQLHWNTYVGWRIYMRHTGCFVFDPRFKDV